MEIDPKEMKWANEPPDRTPDDVLIAIALTDAAWQIKIEPPESAPWEPCTLFFYGSLMNVTLTQAILQLPQPPVFRPGKIHGFKKKMWGAFPALVRSEGDEVHGVALEIEDEEQFLRLQHYETSAYCWCFCDIETEDGAIITKGRTFRWAGHPDSSELEDAEFDLQHFEKHTLPSMIGKRWGFKRLDLHERRCRAQRQVLDD